MEKVTITIPLDFALDIATFGESGKIPRLTQISIEKELKKLGYEKELNETRKNKTKNLFKSLDRVLGSDNMKKIDDAVKIGVNAIKVANRMNNKN